MDIDNKLEVLQYAGGNLGCCLFLFVWARSFVQFQKCSKE